MSVKAILTEQQKSYTKAEEDALLAQKAAKKNGIYYGICSTAENIYNKTVTISGVTELYEGLSIAVKFTYQNHYVRPSGSSQVQSMTLNVNNLGAVTIYAGAFVSPEGFWWDANQVVNFTYRSYTVSSMTIYHWEANFYPRYASADSFGLVKTSSVMDVTAGSIAATPLAVKTAYDALDTNKADKTNGVYYGRCQTAAATAAKEVSITGVTSYYAGLHIRVRFDYAQEATETVTLNVNNLGALQLRTFASNSGLATVGEWSGGSILDIEYQDFGTPYWIIVNSPHATTNTYGRTILSSSSPQMDGEATSGSTGTVSDAGHVHPTDITRAPVYGFGKNFLRNWYFLGGGSQQGQGQFPINNRGLTTYTGSTFAIDGWYLSGSTRSLTITTNGIELHNSNGLVALDQQLENPLPDGDWTFSILVYNFPTCAINVRNGSSQYLGVGAAISGNGFQLASATYSGSELQILRITEQSNTGGGGTVVAVKLERGKEQTLAHQENGVWVLNGIPNYEEELIKCQTCVANTNDTFANQVISMNNSHQNLIDNWYFIGEGTGAGVFPINQRGVTGASSSYFIDRWRSGSNDQFNITFTNQGMTVTNASSTTIAIPQDLNNSSALLGKQVCLSILTSTGLYKSVGVLPSTFNNSGVQSQITVSNGTDNIGMLYVTSTNIQVRLRSPANSGAIIFIAVKLELGSQQTLAYLENGSWVLNEIPNYYNELIKCQTSVADSADIYANKIITTNVINKNLLDNAYFKGGGTDNALPVNQRRQTTYTQASGLQNIFDRWKLSRGTATLTSDGVNLQWGGSSVGASGATLRQIILGNPYVGKIVTLSVLSNKGLLKVTTQMSASTNVYSAVSNDVLLHLFINNTNTLVDIEVRSTTAITLYAAKLEFGTEQTLAHQENGAWILNEIPFYRDVLSVCKRYYQVIRAISSNNTISVASASSATIMYGGIVISPMISTNPTIAASNLLFGQGALTQGNVSSVGWIDFDKDSGIGTLQFTASGLTTNAFYRIGIASGTNLTFSAEP